jgi:hypothetical protein
MGRAGGRQEDRVMSDPVTACRLPQPHAAAEHAVLGEFGCSLSRGRHNGAPDIFSLRMVLSENRFPRFGTMR